MRLIFAGTPAFAAAALEALHAQGHEIALVLTQPDRPAGRGLRPVPSAVKQAALARGLAVFQPPALRDPAALEALAEHKAEAMVVAAYGLILPPAVLALPPRGCLNIHASLLPRWRGAAPIQRALLSGDSETGISIMQMDAGLDTGPVILREAIPIATDDNARTLHDRLAALGARLIVQALEHPGTPQAQEEQLATYAAKIEKREALLDWSQPAALNALKVRAFNPAPGAATSWRGAPLKIWRAEVVDAQAGEAAGVVLGAEAGGFMVACGAGALRLLELQRAGGKRMEAGAFLAGAQPAPGERLGG